MEKRITKVSFHKSGNGIGARINLSMPLLKKMGITTDERDVAICYEEDRITITKSKKEE